MLAELVHSGLRNNVGAILAGRRGKLRGRLLGGDLRRDLVSDYTQSTRKNKENVRFKQVCDSLFSRDYSPATWWCA